MRLIYTLFLLLISVISSKSQNPLEELLPIEESGKRFVTSKIPVEYLEKYGKDNLYHFDAGVLFISKTIKEKRIDTITLEMLTEDDSIIDVKTKHSLQLPQGKRILPKYSDRNCISTDNGYSFQFMDLNPALRNVEIPLNEKNQAEIKSFVKKYNEENHTRTYHINTPQKLQWLPMDSLDLEGMRELNLGVMPSTYQDKTGNIFVVFTNGYYTKFREILCSGGRGIKMAEIQKVLKKRGFDVTITNYADNKTKAALVRFQKENNLPIGNLNLETLEALGLDNYLYK